MTHSTLYLICPIQSHTTVYYSPFLFIALPFPVVYLWGYRGLIMMANRVCHGPSAVHDNTVSLFLPAVCKKDYFKMHWLWSKELMAQAVRLNSASTIDALSLYSYRVVTFIWALASIFIFDKGYFYINEMHLSSKLQFRLHFWTVWLYVKKNCLMWGTPKQTMSFWIQCTCVGVPQQVVVMSHSSH